MGHGGNQFSITTLSFEAAHTYLHHYYYDFSLLAYLGHSMDRRRQIIQEFLLHHHTDSSPVFHIDH